MPKMSDLFYCSAEANSQYQVDTVKDALEKLVIPVNIMHSLIPTISLPLLQQLPMTSDVIYVPTDNTVASNTEIINNICLPAKVPVIAGEEGICRDAVLQHFPSAIMTLVLQPVRWQLRFFKDGEDISKMPIEYAPKFTKEYNKDICEELGIKVPDDYVAIGADAEEETSEDDTDAADSILRRNN